MSTGALFSLFSRSYPGPSSRNNRAEDHLGIVAYPRYPQSSSINLYYRAYILEEKEWVVVNEPN